MEETARGGLGTNNMMTANRKRSLAMQYYDVD